MLKSAKLLLPLAGGLLASSYLLYKFLNGKEDEEH